MAVMKGPGGHPALTDPETGLPNRLHFDTVFDVVFATASRGVPVAVLLLELDRFPDWAGRTEAAEAGRALRVIRDALVPLVRRSDLLARTGEARFAFCLVDCNLAGAMLVADRIDGLKDSLGPATGLGFSIGGAAFDRDMDRPTDLLGAAEQALRVAQNRGANQTEFHQ
jgi:diguanylate cyclase (GGDEF)-like protein